MEYECEVCGTKFTGINNLAHLGVSVCAKCLKYPESKRFIESKLGKTVDFEAAIAAAGNEDSQNSNAPTEKEEPFHPISYSLYLLAFITSMGGLYFFFALWPGPAEAGRSWNAIVYVPSFSWLCIGLAQAAFFTATGKGLIYLKEIAENTKKH